MDMDLLFVSNTYLVQMDPYGRALKDFAQEEEVAKLMVNTSYGKPEEIPLWYFFREYEEMPTLEQLALSVCEGRVLDIGGGTGSHAICLQQMQREVTAIDTSSEAVDIMKASKVKDARNQDFFSLEGEQFDTLLGLMNGIGFIGTLDRLGLFLKKADELLSREGQIILDSSDISYLYEGEEKPKDRYYGEVQFQYEYKGQKGDWFDWVYIDMDTLTEKAYDLGWITYILNKDENDQYLARLVRR